MRNNDWYFRDDDDFGEALHRRTEELYNVPDALPDEHVGYRVSHGERPGCTQAH